MTNDTPVSPPSYPASYPPPAPPPAPPPYWQPQPRVSAPVNGFAIAAMVLGIVWLYWLGSLLAVIFGHVALRQINDNGGGGRGMAIAGLVLGYVGLGILAIGVLAAIAASSGASVRRNHRRRRSDDRRRFTRGSAGRRAAPR